MCWDLKIQWCQPRTVLSRAERVLGVCLGILPHFVLGLHASRSHTLKLNVLGVSLHPASHIQPAAATVSETEPQPSSAVSAWMVLLQFPFTYCPYRLLFHVKHIHFQRTSSRHRSLLFLWTGWSVFTCSKGTFCAHKVLLWTHWCIPRKGYHREVCLCSFVDDMR